MERRNIKNSFLFDSRMVNIRAINEQQASDCMDSGEFASEIISSNKHVAVVLTQSWCPQWMAMEEMIEDIDDLNIDVWSFIYDKSRIFDQFLDFKENMLGNDEIPYIRYYRDGELVDQTNAVDIERFLEILQPEA
jgi:hypothetical protein